MSRTARIPSVSEYYHIIIRGNGKQIIFEDPADRYFFLHMLEKYSGKKEVFINAYCLMENHVHLLVHDPNRRKSEMMHDLEVCYAGYFNEKYERTGHLFQGRFRSEPVNTEDYLLTVFRYILNNPVKAGICPADRYQWSSFSLYGRTDTFVDTTLLCSMIGSWDQYLQFMSVEDTTECLEYDKYHDDAWAKDIIKKRLGLDSGHQLQHFNKADRDDAIRMLRKEGLQCCQIERLTGISHNIVMKAGTIESGTAAQKHAAFPSKGTTVPGPNVPDVNSKPNITERNT